MLLASVLLGNAFTLYARKKDPMECSELRRPPCGGVFLGGGLLASDAFAPIRPRL